MLALDFLGVLFARTMHVGVEMAFVRPPMLRIQTREPEGLQQRFELQKDCVFAAPKDIRQDSPCMMIDRMPQPAGVAFIADKRPHLVHLGVLPSTLDGYRHVVWVVGAQERGVHRLQRGFFLPEFTEHGVRTDPQHPCGIAHATGVETPVNDLVFHRGQPPEVSVVKEKTPRGTRGVLAQVPLGPAACFPTFDDLLTLTMWTPDCDERHEILLVSRRCQERAQCDINLSPSPHLEHYPILFHLLVPGGKWHTEIRSPISSANRCNSTFHRRHRLPFDPPPSAVISNRFAR